MACDAAGHGTIRLHELAMPSSTDSITAALTAGYIPKSSQLTISSRASRGYPGNSLDRPAGVTAVGPVTSSIPAS